MLTRPSILALREFYSSPLGRRTKQILRQRLLDYWPHHTDLHILGIGYTIPVLRALERDKPAALIPLMPADQGAIYWPVHSHNRTILGDLEHPPLRSQSLDRVVALHGIEWAENPSALLAIYWDLLLPGGRLVLMLPRRHGIWARWGNTPFHKSPACDAGTVKKWLFDSGFTLRDCTSALFFPPSNHPFFLRFFNSIEWIGRWIFPRAGGLLLIEAEKQIYAGLVRPLPITNYRKKWAAQPAGAHCDRPAG